MSQRSKWSLIGIPDHQGVVNVGGRIGAARGPSAFRKAFARLKGRDGVHDSCRDAGDSTVAGRGEIEKSHRFAADLVRDQHLGGEFSVVIGGGHDHGYSQLLGVRDSGKKRLGCINIDAHLDVRRPAPLPTSGSPFYLALETGVIRPEDFVEFGIQESGNAPELWEYVESKKIQVVSIARLRHGKAAPEFMNALKRLTVACDAVVVSLDLDAAASAFAPGVSAPQAEGFSASDFIEMMELAGAEPRVVSLGIFELNPELDVDERTAKLAATCAYAFVASALASRARG